MTLKPECERDFENAHQNLMTKIRLNNVTLCRDFYKEWIVPYLDEEALGIAIRQRLQRLMEKQNAEQQQKGYDEKPPDYDFVSETTNDMLGQELTSLRGVYWQHQTRLSRYERIRPDDRYSGKELTLLRTHRDRYGYPYSWVFDRERCAVSGGCCGRTCGCCERSLNQCFQPRAQARETSMGKASKLLELLGHCTVECACLYTDSGLLYYTRTFLQRLFKKRPGLCCSSLRDSFSSADSLVLNSSPFV